MNTESPAYRAAELSALLARHYPQAATHAVARVVSMMQSAARAAVSWEVRRCNCAMSERQEKVSGERLMKLQDNVNDLLNVAELHVFPADWAGCHTSKHLAPATLSLGGDPRGPCARLTIPGQRGDGWGDGFAVY